MEMDEQIEWAYAEVNDEEKNLNTNEVVMEISVKESDRLKTFEWPEEWLIPCVLGRRIISRAKQKNMRSEDYVMYALDRFLKETKNEDR